MIDSHSANATAARFVTVYAERADLGEQSGGRRGGAEVAAPAVEPAVEQVLGRPAVSVDVDVHRQRPFVLGHLEVGADGEAGVGEEQVDRAERARSAALISVDVAGLGRDVGAATATARSSPLRRLGAASSTSATTTLAPPAWKRRASAAPMPRAAPVTTTLAPSSSIRRIVRGPVGLRRAEVDRRGTVKA